MKRSRSAKESRETIDERGRGKRKGRQLVAGLIVALGAAFSLPATPASSACFQPGWDCPDPDHEVVVDQRVGAIALGMNERQATIAMRRYGQVTRVETDDGDVELYVKLSSATPHKPSDTLVGATLRGGERVTSIWCGFSSDWYVVARGRREHLLSAHLRDLVAAYGPPIQARCDVGGDCWAAWISPNLFVIVSDAESATLTYYEVSDKP